MKKRLPFIPVIILVLISVGFIIFNKVSLSTNDKKTNDPIIEEKESYVESEETTLLTSTPKFVEEEQEVQEEKETKEKINVSSKQETTTNQDIKKQEILSSNESSNINSNNNSEITIEINSSTEETIQQIDSEYERLKSLIKYKNDMDCYYASFDVSLEYIDDENFQVVTCSSYAYKGELLGYRMVVHFYDGTVKYLDAID